MNRKHAVAIGTLSLALLAACSGTSAEPPRSSTSPASSTTPATSAEVHWGYEGSQGPGNWGTLNAQWKACGEGRGQSPIDIADTGRADLPALRAEFKPATLKIIHHQHVADAINNGHTIQVNYTEGDSLLIGDQRFQLLQYHFHSPSEHTVGGKHFPMEMHLVHKSADGKLAVVGVFIKEGKHNTAFDPIWSNLPNEKSKEYHHEKVEVDVNALLPAKTTSYRYDGSLTTPPCSEGVKWIVMSTPIQLSAKQIQAFRNIIRGNNRPVQSLNGRAVVTDRVVESEEK